MYEALLPSTVDLERTLRERFGFSSFHTGQQEIIERVVSGHDTLAILATGAGKSLCYQLPALLLEGTTVVVSPLIALMKDQLDMLASCGINDILAFNSTLSEDEEVRTQARLAAGNIKLVFVTPERLEDQQFMALLQKLTIPLFVVDEAHCISTWGHDFRPAYLALGQAVAKLGKPTILALTATATPAVRDDILMQLGMGESKPIVRGFDRPELQYEVRRAEREPDKLKILAQLINSGLQGPGIVYAATIKNALEVQQALRRSCEVPVALYHSRLRKSDRDAVHELFMNDTVQIVVATNAFGLGIDKPNIRFVVHYDLPGSIEAYTQEAGRAGRDGETSRCILLYRMSDTRVQNYFLTGKYPDTEDVQRVYRTLECFMAQAGGVSLGDLRKITQLPLTKLRVVLALLKRAEIVVESGRNAYTLAPCAVGDVERVLNVASYESKKTYDQSKLAMMLQYAESASCRRRFILNYFGENYAEGGCGACDNCRRKPQARIRETHGDPVHSGYRIADLVRHPKFGDGSVERVEHDLVTVLFPSIGYKTLLASAVNRREE